MSYQVGDIVEIIDDAGHSFAVGSHATITNIAAGACPLRCQVVGGTLRQWLREKQVKIIAQKKPIDIRDIKKHDILQYKDDFLFVNETYIALDAISVSSILGIQFTDIVSDLKSKDMEDVKQVVCNLHDIFSNI